MKKTTLMIAALALTTIFGGFVSAQAAVCNGAGATTANAPRRATDPFGSCEEANGDVKCGSGTNLAGIATLIVDQAKGVQGCSNKADLLPIGGRVSIYKDGANNVAIAADGSDSENSGGASAWQRYDVRPNTGTPTKTAVCARRGTAGTWYTGAESGRGTSAADNVNQGIDGTADRTPCGGNPTPA